MTEYEILGRASAFLLSWSGVNPEGICRSEFPDPNSHFNTPVDPCQNR